MIVQGYYFHFRSADKVKLVACGGNVTKDTQTYNGFEGID